MKESVKCEMMDNFEEQKEQGWIQFGIFSIVSKASSKVAYVRSESMFFCHLDMNALFGE